MAKANGSNGNGNGNGKPPAQQADARDTGGRWKPGVSGNPKGRPPGPDLTARLRAALTRAEKKGKQAAEKVVDTVVAQALNGERWAIELIWDRMEGKALERVFTGELVTFDIDWGDIGDNQDAAASSEASGDRS